MITCYLDSLDYSTLTDPRRDTAEIREIKDTLTHLAVSNQVRFVFSATTISESAPLAANATHLAELRAELLYELCGSNALLWHGTLANAEVNALAHQSGPLKDILDPQGRWFPETLVDEKPVSHWEGMRQTTEKMLQDQGLPRHERRAKLRTLFKNGKPRPALRALWTQRGVDAYAADLLAVYPMRPEDADAFIRYIFGEAPEETFNEALTNSLSDVRWMMKWFSSDLSLASPISEIVRKPGREMGQLMRELAESTLEGVLIFQDSGYEDSPTGKNGKVTSFWHDRVDSQLLSIIRRKASVERIKIGEIDVGAIGDHCPGLSTVMRSMFSSVWSNVGEGRKERPSDSQPVDAMHALYAPYVDVFRADKFMAPHIQRQVKSAGTIVVPLLSQLVDILDAQLT